MKLRFSHAFFLFILCSHFAIMAQSPAMFNYQAVLRDDAGEIMMDENVTIEVEILKDGPQGGIVFSETHQTQTNAFGLIQLQIGSVNSLEGMAWADHPHFIRISVNGINMGTHQLVSVPYALHAATSADTFSGDYGDLTNTPDLENFISIVDPAMGDMFYFNGETWVSLPLGEEGQVLTIVGGLPQWADLPTGDDDEDTVTDIDGNVYPTVTIGEQEWMAKNLRTSTFADGTPIPGNLTNSQWQANTTGAWAVYPHDNIAGIDSEEEMLNAYGALYNWFAVNNPSGLCPEGWHVATDDDWTQLTNYLINNYDWIEHGNAANAMKSCRQVNSPLGGDCATELHPRWDMHSVHYGTDDFGFAALPGGSRQSGGSYSLMGGTGYWWTSTEFSVLTVYYRDLDAAYGSVLRAATNRERGFSIRCVKTIN